MLSTETNQCGLTGQMPSSTKPHLFVFGGHSGKGMVTATEIAASGRTCAITTISKRGKPNAPGPASAFAQAMASQTVHYMAACDEKDVKAVECLMEWTAPSMQPLPEARFNVTEVLDEVKKEIEDMNQLQLERALATVKGLKNTVQKNQRQIKARLDYKECSDQEKTRLQDMRLELQEKEACFLELMADLQQKLGEAPASGEALAICHADTNYLLCVPSPSVREMDFQHRAGGKTGGGGVAGWSESNRDRKERLRKLALETIDLAKDPYFMKNHLGTYECKLCLTLHNTEGSYLAHTQGKKHQSNLAKRAAKEAKDAQALPAPEKVRVDIKRFVKIGRPGYKVTKQRDPNTGQHSLFFQVDYPEIVDGVMPRHRFMSAYEQRVEPPDRQWQYLLFAAEPYETIAFKIPSREVDKGEDRFWTEWNPDTKQFFLQFHFKQEDTFNPQPAR